MTLRLEGAYSILLSYRGIFNMGCSSNSIYYSCLSGTADASSHNSFNNFPHLNQFGYFGHFMRLRSTHIFIFSYLIYYNIFFYKNQESFSRRLFRFFTALFQLSYPTIWAMGVGLEPTTSGVTGFIIFKNRCKRLFKFIF